MRYALVEREWQCLVHDVLGCTIIIILYDFTRLAIIRNTINPKKG